MEVTYIIAYSTRAQEDIAWWKKNGSEAARRKISALLKELETHPETGTGKPERLKGDLSGFWSRRINDKDRLVYEIRKECVVVLVLSMRGHYSDK